MTESEIVSMYRDAKNKSAQISILTELNATRRSKIIGILSRAGQEIPEKEQNRLMAKIDRMGRKIKDLEKEYAEICRDITGTT